MLLNDSLMDFQRLGNIKGLNEICAVSHVYIILSGQSCGTGPQFVGRLKSQGHLGHLVILDITDQT